MKSRTALAATLLACACADITLVPVKEQVAPALNISVIAGQSVAFSDYAFSAYLYPGVDAATGKPLDVGSPAIVVNDTVLLPVEKRTNEGIPLLRYDWQRRREAGQPPIDTLRLDLPQIPGPPSARFRVYVQIAGRADPATVDVMQGVLRLHITAPEPPALAIPTVTPWILSIREQCSNGASPAVSVQGSGRYPPEFVIPREWFAALSDSAMACFSAFSTYELSEATPVTRIGTSTSIEWRVRIP